MDLRAGDDETPKKQVAKSLTSLNDHSKALPWDHTPALLLAAPRCCSAARDFVLFGATTHPPDTRNNGSLTWVFYSQTTTNTGNTGSATPRKPPGPLGGRCGPVRCGCALALAYPRLSVRLRLKATAVVWMRIGRASPTIASNRRGRIDSRRRARQIQVVRYMQPRCGLPHCIPLAGCRRGLRNSSRQSSTHFSSSLRLGTARASSLSESKSVVGRSKSSVFGGHTIGWALASLKEGGE